MSLPTPHGSSPPTDARQPIEIALSPIGMARFFAWVIGSLLFLHTVVETLRFATGNDRLFGLVYFFALGADGNFPTLCSTLIMLSAVILLVVIASQATSDNGYWWVLAAVFVFLTCDEALGIHDRLNKPLRGMLQATGALYYAWLIPYGIASVVFALAYWPFMRRLTPRTALLFMLSGGIYVLGAAGMEMIGGIIVSEHPDHPVAYVLEQTIEETMELTGMALFSYSLADHVARHLGGLTLRMR